ncbi:MAG: glutamine synthetase, partial [Desulfobacula sp.]|nr:glutamine synthetase [Desulfobacula sp.]
MTLDIKTVDDAKKIIKERAIEYVKVGVFDIDGIFRGKYMQASKFLHVLDKGFGYCNVVLGWDSNDQLYNKDVTITGWHTGYSDASVKIVPQTCRELPMEKNTLLFIGEFDGEFEQVCPRGLLKRVIKKAEDMG